MFIRRVDNIYAIKFILGEYMYAVMVLEVEILLLAMYVLTAIYFYGM